MRRAFVFGADPFLRRLIGAIVFGSLGAAASVSCSNGPSGAMPFNSDNPDGTDYDSTFGTSSGSSGGSSGGSTMDHVTVGSPESGGDGPEDAASEATDTGTVDVSPDVPSDAATDATGDVATDGGGDAPVDAPADVAIDHCAMMCGSGSSAVCTDTNADPNNCGACGHHCGLGGTCSSGTCVCPTGTLTCSSTNTCEDPTLDGNCGGCGNVCTGGYCATGIADAGPGCKTPSVVATTSASIGVIAVDPLYVYWTVGTTSGGVYAKSLSGGMNLTVSAPLSGANAIAVTTNLYWASTVTGEVDYSTAYNATHSPQIHTIVPGTDAGTGEPVAIAADSSNIYWTDITAEAVYQAPRTGGTIVTIAQGQNQPMSIAIDANRIYWLNLGTGGAPDGALMSAPIGSADAGSPVVDAGDDGGADAEAGFSTPEAGTSVVTLAAGQTYPQGIAVDSTYVYWTSTSGTVQAIPKTSSGGATPIVIASGQGAPYGIVVDTNPAVKNYVYWVNNHSNTVYRAPVPSGGAAGGIPSAIASGMAAVQVPTTMAIDSPTSSALSGMTNVYWANTGNGTIMTLQVH